jgi:hypothetical protein
MTRRLYFLLVIVCASGLIAVGCGGDDDDSGGDDSPAATQEQTGTTDTTPTATTEPETTGTDTTDVPDEAIQQAVENCKQSVSQFPPLSDETRSDLEEICERASDNASSAIEASEEVCKMIVEDTVPEGTGDLREQALAACELTTP